MVAEVIQKIDLYSLIVGDPAKMLVVTGRRLNGKALGDLKVKRRVRRWLHGWYCPLRRELGQKGHDPTALTCKPPCAADPRPSSRTMEVDCAWEQRLRQLAKADDDTPKVQRND